MSAVDMAALSALYLRSETGFKRSEFPLRLRQYRFWHKAAILESLNRRLKPIADILV
jgi:hypothetical protein